MKRLRSRRAAITSIALVAGTSLAMGTLTIPAAGIPPASCPEAMPTEDLEAGMTGIGYTVSKGTEPEPFDAEILGVYPDAILPGRDLVIAEVHSPAIDKVGGVWFGMSGSPVYLEDGGEEKLVGAVAWGFSFGPSHIIGLTAGQDMVELLDYPNPVAAPASSAATPSKIQLTTSMKRRIARATNMPVANVADSFTQLKMPVSVSGLGASGMKRLGRRLNRAGMKVRPFAGASVARDLVADPSELQAGSNFAAALSYGDLTVAGVGTTTFVCEGFAVAFGHPFDFAGETKVGANTATALTIWEDPVFSPFKLATISGSVGAVDQDRFAGIRADFGEPLTTIPITSRTFAEDLSRETVGRTDAATSEIAAFIAPEHEYLNIISAMDSAGAGSAETRWTVTGTRADGSTFSLSRSDMASSRYEIAFEAIYDTYEMIYELYFQDFEEIEFTSIDWEQVTVREEIRQYQIGRVLVSKDGDTYTRRRSVTARPGSTLYLRVLLDPFQDDADSRKVDFTLRVPRNAHRSGEIQIFGGPLRRFGLARGAKSFDDLLDKMRDLPVQNSLNVNLRIGRKVRDDGSSILDQVVRGQKSIFVRVRG
jgi:SpoIVB peptidase S55